MRNVIKKMIKKLGFVVLKNKNYQKISSQILQPKQLNHTIHLDLLMQLLKDIGYKPNMIYDIGANRGGWTASALEYFPDSNYVLFEPQINLVEIINNRFKKKSNVRCYPFGVGNIKDILKFTIHDRDDSCNFRMTKEEADESGFKQVEVPIVALDAFIKDEKLQYPNILKIDAEGIDLQVIEGAKETIQNYTQVILVEVAIMNPTFANTALIVMEKMDSLGFKLFDITDLNRPFETKVLWLSEFVFIRKNGILDKVHHI